MKRLNIKGFSLFELVVAITLIILAYSAYLYSVGGSDPVKVKQKAVKKHITTLSYLIKSQEFELGCRPKNIKAMASFTGFKEANANTCEHEDFENPWNGPYFGDLQYKNTGTGKINLDYIHKGYYGILEDTCYKVLIDLDSTAVTIAAKDISKVITEDNSCD